MSDSVVENLIADLLEWLGNRERPYDEVIDAWRTSCPRLQVWEEANDRGLIVTQERNARRVVSVTEKGRAFLEQRKSLHQAKSRANSSKA